MTATINSSVLKDVVAYVDVWSSDKRANYSKTFIQQLEEMGAQVSKRLSKQVTHVVFNNGHPATWRNAKKSGVQLVSVLWVRRCYEEGAYVDEKLFPALNDETNPVMKNRKHRCMLPKDSPERTTENDWRMKKKLDKMMKDMPPKEPLVIEMSPIVIDEENGIIYSPALKRSDYMAKRLKDMKDKRENLSPTASQMAESCSPTELRPSLGSTPTVCKFKLNNLSDDDSCASVADLGCSPDKEEGRSRFDFRDHSHLEQDSTKPWLSPCRDIPKRSTSVDNCSDFEGNEDKEGNQLTKSRRASTRKKATEKLKSGDFLESPLQERSDKHKTFHKRKKLSQIKSSSPSPNKCEKGKQKIRAAKSLTDTESHICPDAVNSISSPSSSNLFVAATEMSKDDSSLLTKIERKTPKRARSTSSASMGSFRLSSKSKYASNSTDGDDVFEDFFSPANRKRSLFPNLSVKSNIQLPFELDPSPRKRKRRSESFGSGTDGRKTPKLADSHGGKSGNKQSKRSTEPQCLQQQESERSVPPQDSHSVDAMPVTEKQSTLASPRTSKITSDTGKLKPASTSGQPSLQIRDVGVLGIQTKADFPILSDTLESGGNECMAPAAFTEIPSEAEENHKKQLGLTSQSMVKKTKPMRTLVMTSMPSEKQHTVCQVVKTLGGFSIVDQVCESTTHVVSGGHKRTLNILLGIARGCWILSFEWILWCLEQRQWIPEEPYELSDQFPAAQICRLQRHLSAGEHQQDLFQNQPAMFISQQSQPPTQSLVELIQLCGGTVCRTVRQAGICIGKYSGRRPEGSRILSEQWILDSISNLKILSYDIYDLE